MLKIDVFDHTAFFQPGGLQTTFDTLPRVLESDQSGPSYVYKRPNPGGEQWSLSPSGHSAPDHDAIREQLDRVL